MYEDREGDFYKVSVGNGKYGYIPYWLVTTNFAGIETDETIPQGIKKQQLSSIQVTAVKIQVLL